jgi:hypothetical protein
MSESVLVVLGGALAAGGYYLYSKYQQANSGKLNIPEGGFDETLKWTLDNIKAHGIERGFREDFTTLEGRINRDIAAKEKSGIIPQAAVAAYQSMISASCDTNCTQNVAMNTIGRQLTAAELAAAKDVGTWSGNKLDASIDKATSYNWASGYHVDMKQGTYTVYDPGYVQAYERVSDVKLLNSATRLGSAFTGTPLAFLLNADIERKAAFFELRGALISDGIKNREKEAVAYVTNESNKLTAAINALHD